MATGNSFLSHSLLLFPFFKATCIGVGTNCRGGKTGNTYKRGESKQRLTRKNSTPVFHHEGLDNFLMGFVSNERILYK